MARNRVDMHFKLPVTKRNIVHYAAQLVQACSRWHDGATVHLSLGESVSSPVWSGHGKWTASAMEFMALVAEKGADNLGAITSVELVGVELDAVVPSWIANVCPQVETLLLDNCRLLRSATHSRTYAPLQSLTLTVETVPLPPSAHDRAEMPAWLLEEAQQATDMRWQRQLNSLPGLTSLSIEVPPTLLEGCPGLQARLTYLELNRVVIDDESMAVLLRMTQLATLRTTGGFRLQSSYADRPCNWAELGVPHIDVAQLALLNLDDLTTIKVTSTKIVRSRDEAACNKVAAAIARCGGLTVTFNLLSSLGEYPGAARPDQRMDVALNDLLG